MTGIYIHDRSLQSVNSQQHFLKRLTFTCVYQVCAFRYIFAQTFNRFIPVGGTEIQMPVCDIRIHAISHFRSKKLISVACGKSVVRYSVRN
jgi:hypothetical protein